MKNWVSWLLGACGLGALAWYFASDQTPLDVVTELTRTPEDILNAVAQIDPEHNPELQPGYTNEYGTKGTWCNKFIALVTALLGAPVPYGRAGMTADQQISWLSAGNGGWYPVSKEQAQQLAIDGHLALATYYNLNGSGHMALVLPYPGSMQVAQAGARNFNAAPLSYGFGNLQPVFFGHD